MFSARARAQGNIESSPRYSRPPRLFAAYAIDDFGRRHIGESRAQQIGADFCLCSGRCVKTSVCVELEMRVDAFDLEEFRHNSAIRSTFLTAAGHRLKVSLLSAVRCEKIKAGAGAHAHCNLGERSRADAFATANLQSGKNSTRPAFMSACVKPSSDRVGSSAKTTRPPRGAQTWKRSSSGVVSASTTCSWRDVIGCARAPTM